MHIGFEFPNAILEHYLEQPRFKLKRKTITLRRLSTLMFLIEHDHVTTYGKPFAWSSFGLSNPYSPFISNTSTKHYYDCLNGAPITAYRKDSASTIQRFPAHTPEKAYVDTHVRKHWDTPDSTLEGLALTIWNTHYAPFFNDNNGQHHCLNNASNLFDMALKGYC